MTSEPVSQEPAPRRPPSDPRYPVRLAVRFNSARSYQEQYALNLSRGGLFVAGMTHLELGEEITVTVELPGMESFDVGYRVAQVITDERAEKHGRTPGSGLQAIAEPPGFKKALRRYLKILSGRARSKVLVGPGPMRESLRKGGYSLLPLPPVDELATFVEETPGVFAVVVPLEDSQELRVALQLRDLPDLVVPVEDSSPLSELLETLDRMVATRLGLSLHNSPPSLGGSRTGDTASGPEAQGSVAGPFADDDSEAEDPGLLDVGDTLSNGGEAPAGDLEAPADAPPGPTPSVQTDVGEHPAAPVAFKEISPDALFPSQSSGAARAARRLLWGRAVVAGLLLAGLVLASWLWIGREAPAGDPSAAGADRAPVEGSPPGATRVETSEEVVSQRVTEPPAERLATNPTPTDDFEQSGTAASTATAPTESAEPTGRNAIASTPSAAEPAGEIVSITAVERDSASIVSITTSLTLSAGDVTSLLLENPQRYLVTLRRIARHPAAAVGTEHIRGLRLGVHQGDSGPETHLVFDLSPSELEASTRFTPGGVEVIVRALN